MKAVVLVRVSTREQQEEGLSIKAQLERLKNYCDRKKFEVIKIFEIVESSTQGERKRFYEMIAFIKQQEEKIALVADRVDRIQRSFKESVELDDLRKQRRLSLHFIRESLVIDEDSKSFDIMMWDFAVMGAKSYVLNLADNVKSTLNYKLENGEWIGQAYVGYLNAIDPTTKKNTVVIDENRAPFVRKAFELYATGNYSVREIARILKDEGLTNIKGLKKPLAPARVHDMLRNPFYYGLMRCKGNLYPHKYETIVEKALFDKCQAVMEGWHKKPFKYAAKPFPLRGLVRCAHCGCSVTFDKKKGKYIYGCCTKYKGNCGATRVTEEALLQQVGQVFKHLRIPEGAMADIKERLEQTHDAQERYHKQALASLRCEYDRIQNQLKVLLEMRISESITQDEYDKKAIELKQRQYDIDGQLKSHTKADEQFGVTVSYLLDVVSRAADLFESSKADQKRQLINLVLSNLELKGKKLHFNLKEPFNAIVAANKSKDWLRGWDSNPQPFG